MTDLLGTEPRLSDLSEAERAARFSRLQERLVGVWGAMRLNQAGESIVVVPSVTPDGTLSSGASVQGLEGRRDAPSPRRSSSTTCRSCPA